MLKRTVLLTVFLWGMLGLMVTPSAADVTEPPLGPSWWNEHNHPRWAYAHWVSGSAYPVGPGDEFESNYLQDTDFSVFYFPGPGEKIEVTMGDIYDEDMFKKAFIFIQGTAPFAPPPTDFAIDFGTVPPGGAVPTITDGSTGTATTFLNDTWQARLEIRTCDEMTVASHLLRLGRMV